jgi:hypothetical protein
MRKLWCSVCKEEYNGTLEDGSYFDEDTHQFHHFPDSFAIHPKCGLSTGSIAMEEHFIKLNEWTTEKDIQRKQLNREYAKLRRDKTRIRKFSPKPKSST